MALSAQLVRDDRESSREALNVGGTLRQDRNTPIDVVVEDLSVTGFRIRTQANLNLQEKIMIGIPGIGQRPAYVVRQAAGGFGCRFIDVIDAQLITVPTTAHSVVETAFGRQLDAALVRKWSYDVAPHVERFSQNRRLLIVGVLGIAGWLGVVGLISLF